MSKVALITGGSSGIGNAIAINLHAKGLKVYGTSRNPDKQSEKYPFALIKMDVHDSGSVQNAVAELIEKEGSIDVLVNNAGVGIVGSIEDTNIDEVKDVFETNIYGLLRVTQACLPCMRKQKSGYIINISSIAGQMGLPFRGIYSASKFAVEAITESLSLEVRPYQIKVSVIEPGDFNTNINDNRKTAAKAQNGSAYQEQFNRIHSQIHEEVKTSGDPAIVGDLVYKIISDPNPGLRYQVGAPIQKLSVTAKNLLPPRIFEKILLKHYKIN